MLRFNITLPNNPFDQPASTLSSRKTEAGESVVLKYKRLLSIALRVSKFASYNYGNPVAPTTRIHFEPFLVV
jgi:hypothetical protein